MIVRKAMPGRFATLEEGVTGLAMAAVEAEEAVEDWLDYEERAAIAHDRWMDSQDPFHPSYYRDDIAAEIE